MVAQVTKSSLLARINQRGRAADERTKDLKPTYGNPTLPAGIENGIAQLVDIKFGEYKEGDNKGQIYFMARGSVRLPVEFKGLPIKNLFTQIGPEPLCDTPNKKGKRKTFDEHYAWIKNQIAILMDNPEVAITKINFDNIEQKIAELKKAQPYFRFRTWKGKETLIKEISGKWWAVTGDKKVGPYASKEEAEKKNPFADREPMIQHDWNGACEFSEVDESSNGTVDESRPIMGELPHNPELDTNGVEATNGEAVATEEFPPTEEEGYSAEPEITEESEPQGTDEEEIPFSEFDDLKSLATRADNQDSQAQTTLQEMARKAGVTEQELIDSASWGEVAKIMESKTQTKPQPAKEPAKRETTTKAKPTPKKEYVPEVGNTCKFKQKPGTRPLDCEILSVSVEKKIATVKDLSTNLIYKGVKWADIAD